MLGFGQNDWWSRQLAQRTKTKVSLPRIPSNSKPTVQESLGAETFPKRIFHYGKTMPSTPPKKLLPGRLKKSVRAIESGEVKREIRAWTVPTFSLVTPRNVTLPTSRKPSAPPAPSQNCMNSGLLKSPPTPLSPIKKFKSLSPKFRQRDSRSLSPIDFRSLSPIKSSASKIVQKIPSKSFTHKSALSKVTKAVVHKERETKLDYHVSPQNSIRKYAVYLSDFNLS